MTEAPTRRYWGSRKPPENRADIFATSLAPNAAASGTVATLRLYGPIDSWGGLWGISAADVSAVLDGFGEDVSEIRVRINSPGGEVWEGLTILNMLRAHSAKTVAVVDGLAASAASLIAAGAEETVMSPGTQMMIMAEETWYTAAEATDAGLADRVAVVTDAGESATPGAAAPEPEEVFDLSIFNHAGRSKAPAPVSKAAPQRRRNLATAQNKSGSTTPSEREGSVVAFSDEQLTHMRQQLGCDAQADETTIVAALEEALSERADDDTPTTSGHVSVPEAAWEELQVSARAGAEAAKMLRERDRDAYLDSVREKFLPANRDSWAREYDRDPANTRSYFEAAPTLISTEETGHDEAEPVELAAAGAVTETTAYKNWSM